MALGRIEAAGVANVRLHPGDARDLIELLPAAAVERVFLLYPDPWPKARHHRRRFVSAENLGCSHRVMPPGAELRLATDIPDYVDHALAAVRRAAVAPPPGRPSAPGPTGRAPATRRRRSRPAGGRTT